MLVRRSNEGENPYKKIIIYNKQTTNQDFSDEEEIQREQKFQNEQFFSFS